MGDSVRKRVDVGVTSFGDGERSRFCGSSANVYDENSGSINTVDLLEMEMSAFVLLVVACGKQAKAPTEPGNCR